MMIKAYVSNVEERIKVESMIELSRGEIYVIRDALLEQDSEDVREALLIVEGALYQPERPLDFNDG